MGNMVMQDQTPIVVFNGDADGICALHQLHLVSSEEEYHYVTGVKRDIALLQQISAQKDAEITVLVIAPEKNIDSLNQLLAQGCKIRWFDHHQSPEVPVHPNFEAYIDPSKTTNTAKLVDQYLGHPESLWMIVVLFGVNLNRVALEASQKAGLNDKQCDQLKELGQLLNYKAYGETVADLYYSPYELVEALKPFHSPFEFLDQTEVDDKLREGLKEDMHKARNTKEVIPNGYLLPAEKWERRVFGEFSNSLVRTDPTKAYAILVEKNRLAI
jgi:hypothetical protein